MRCLRPHQAAKFVKNKQIFLTHYSYNVQGRNDAILQGQSVSEYVVVMLHFFISLRQVLSIQRVQVISFAFQSLNEFLFFYLRYFHVQKEFLESGHVNLVFPSKGTRTGSYCDLPCQSLFFLSLTLRSCLFHLSNHVARSRELVLRISFCHMDPSNYQFSCRLRLKRL